MKMLTKFYILLLVVLALLSTTGIVLYSWNGSFSRIRSQICPKVSWDVQQISRTFRPIRPLERDNGQGNDTFSSLLLPDNGGLLKVRMFDDPQKISNYGISMFHQLHCLVVLREIILRNSSSKYAEHDPRTAHVHWAHCFDYLAQVCRAQICR